MAVERTHKSLIHDMADLATYRGFIEQYMVELKELTFNSKPIITTLTILAEEHRNIAPSIAAAIEHHLSSVSPSRESTLTCSLISSLLLSLRAWPASKCAC